MSLYHKIRSLYPSLTEEDFLPGGSISLQNDGQGDYIKAWGHPTLPEPTSEQIVAQSLPAAKRQMLSAIADLRWRKAIGGATINGHLMQTDSQTQGNLAAAVLASIIDNTYTVNWKLADGSWVTLDHTSLLALAQGVRAFVQGCFDREAALSSQINAATDEATLSAIDITSNWPS